MGDIIIGKVATSRSASLARQKAIDAAKKKAAEAAAKKAAANRSTMTADHAARVGAATITKPTTTSTATAPKPTGTTSHATPRTATPPPKKTTPPKKTPPSPTSTTATATGTTSHVTPRRSDEPPTTETKPKTETKPSGGGWFGAVIDAVTNKAKPPVSTKGTDIDTAVPTSSKPGLTAEQKALEKQLAANEKAKQEFVDDHDSGWLGGIITAVGSKVYDVKADNLQESYVEDHDYWVDADGTTYAASFDDHAIQLDRTGDDAGKLPDGTNLTKDTHITVSPSLAREKTTTTKTPAATLTKPQNVLVETTKQDAKGATTGSSVTASTIEKTKSTTTTTSHSESFNGAGTLTEASDTVKNETGSKTETQSTSATFAASGKPTSITDTYDLDEPGNVLHESQRQDLRADGTIKTLTTEHSELTGERADNQFNLGWGRLDGTEDTTKTTTQFDATGNPTSAVKEETYRSAEVDRDGTTTVAFGAGGVPTTSHAEVDTTVRGRDEAGNRTTSVSDSTTDIAFNAKGEPTKIDSDVTTDNSFEDEDGNPVEISSRSQTSMTAGGKALAFDADGNPTNATVTGTIDSTTKLIDPDDDTKTTELVQHGTVSGNGASTDWESLRLIATDFKEDGGINTRDGYDYSKSQLDENGMPKLDGDGNAVEGSKVDELHEDHRSWYQQNKHIIATGLTIVGGIVSLIPLGVTQIVGGAMLIAGGAISLSSSLPAFIDNPSWSGALAVGLDVATIATGGMAGFAGFAKLGASGAVAATGGLAAVETVAATTAAATGAGSRALSVGRTFLTGGATSTTGQVLNAGLNGVQLVGMGQQAYVIGEHAANGTLTKDDWIALGSTALTFGVQRVVNNRIAAGRVPALDTPTVPANVAGGGPAPHAAPGVAAIDAAHIFTGDATGGLHHVSAPGRVGDVVVAERGVAKPGRTWEADVTLPDGTVKKSTMFPKEWSQGEVLSSIEDVRVNGSAVPSKIDPALQEITGTHRGVDIKVIYDPATNSVVTAFPRRGGQEFVTPVRPTGPDGATVTSDYVAGLADMAAPHASGRFIDGEGLGRAPRDVTTRALTEGRLISDEPFGPSGIEGQLRIRTYADPVTGRQVEAIVKNKNQSSAQEVFGAEVARALGLDDHVPVIVRDAAGNAVIERVPGRTWTSGDVNNIADIERVLTEGGLDGVSAKTRAELVSVFDYIIGNNDRHGGNGIVDGSRGQIYLIDSGYAGQGLVGNPMMAPHLGHQFQGGTHAREGTFYRDLSPETVAILKTIDLDRIRAAHTDLGTAPMPAAVSESNRYAAEHASMQRWLADQAYLDGVLRRLEQATRTNAYFYTNEGAAQWIMGQQGFPAPVTAGV